MTDKIQNKLDFDGALGELDYYFITKRSIEIRDTVKSALTLASKVQSGELVVVPSEPTYKMLETGRYIDDKSFWSIGEAYKAMIQAAPKYDWGNEL